MWRHRHLDSLSDRHSDRWADGKTEGVRPALLPSILFGRKFNFLWTELLPFGSRLKHRSSCNARDSTPMELWMFFFVKFWLTRVFMLQTEGNINWRAQTGRQCSGAIPVSMLQMLVTMWWHLEEHNDRGRDKCNIKEAALHLTTMWMLEPWGTTIGVNCIFSWLQAWPCCHW